MVRTAQIASALIVCGFLAVFEAPARAEAEVTASARAGSVAQISVAGFRRMLAESTEEKGGVKTEEGDTLRVELAAENRVLFFTTAAHPAHPAVIAVSLTLEEGVPHIVTDGWRGGNRGAFDVWFQAFTRRNETLARKWQEEKE